MKSKEVYLKLRCGQKVQYIGTYNDQQQLFTDIATRNWTQYPDLISFNPVALIDKFEEEYEILIHGEPHKELCREFDVFNTFASKTGKA